MTFFSTKVLTAIGEMERTFRERNAVYQDNWKLHCKMLMALFPDGLTVKTEDDWARLNFFLMLTGKISRYAQQYEKGGHADSIHDTSVYAVMLECFDEMKLEEAIEGKNT